MHGKFERIGLGWSIVLQACYGMDTIKFALAQRFELPEERFGLSALDNDMMKRSNGFLLFEMYR